MKALVISVFLFGVVTGSPVGDIPYEDDPQHFGEQRFSDMLKMHGQYFVQKRSYETSTQFRCQSATKVEVSQQAPIQYDLKARTGSTYVTYRSTFTPLTTEPHTENNAALYKMSQDLPALTWKIMTVKPEGECLVLVTTLENKKKACQLIISKSKAQAHDLTVCNTIYEEHCEEPSITLYQDDCE